MVVGLNHRTAPLAIRERFWIGENRRYDVLRRLKKAEGIDEAVVLSTCCRTEFVVWASEPTLAANSLLQFLTAEHGLRLSEWEHFYRLLDESALSQIFRVASGLDSLLLGEPQIMAQAKSAWEQARAVGAAGNSLDAIFEGALRVAQQVCQETAIDRVAVSLPTAALELAKQIFGSLEGRNVLLLGAGEISEFAGRRLIENGAASLVVIDQSEARTQELALAMGGTAATLTDRWKHLLHTDIVIAAGDCPHIILTRQEAEHIARERNRVALVILDIGVPRNVDPEVRSVDGILLHDVESLEQVFERDTPERLTAVAQAEAIIAAAVLDFRTRLHAESDLPTAATLRRRLDELCRQEMERFIEERGPFSREQEHSLLAIAGQLIQTIASSLVHEIKEVPDREEQDRINAAITRIFHLDRHLDSHVNSHLDSQQQAITGTISEKHQHEPDRQHAVAI